ncbi:MAG: 4-hydroxy-tetrahydrodipicolinate synthase [Clostridia bacterium]|nr:4-hydroxy-tetrahydrodipicolinate synthase [Clostridia bacterium]
MDHPIYPLFTGCATALVTPFLPDGQLDLSALRRLIALQTDAGIDALVLLGTTGEPCTLSMQEREQIIRTGIDAAQGTPVIVGTGSSDTRLSVEFARQAASLGAAGQLCVTPYYNKCTESGLIRHYTTIMDSSALPLIAYSVPSRTGMRLSAAAAGELSAHPLFAGVKDACGDISFSADLLIAAPAVYCGNDDQTLPLMAMGASGVISVISNLLPKETKALTDACLSGDYASARVMHERLLPIARALFFQVNPIPIKAALASRGLIHDSLRLPLTPMEEPHRSRLMQLMESI